MNIEKKLFPDANKIIRIEDYFKVQIIDSELDPIDVIIEADGNFLINSKDYIYLKLTTDNLRVLLNAQEEVQNIING